MMRSSRNWSCPTEGSLMVSTFDPLDSTPLALAGRVVTMDASHRTLDGVGTATTGTSSTCDRTVTRRLTGSSTWLWCRPVDRSIPGLIELHNHLAYDALPLWQVPQRYDNRDAWGSPNPPYRQLISGPMQVLGDQPSTAAAVARYTEIKCLLGGHDDEPGHAAVLLTSDRPVLPGPGPKRGTDRRPETAQRQGPHPRCGSEGRRRCSWRRSPVTRR